MRPRKASAIGRSTASNPCSRKRAASAASRTAARTLRFFARRSTSSSEIPFACSTRCFWRPSSLETTAQLWRDTTCARRRASSPSVKSGYDSYRARATASSSTLSPRNSRRSYESARSAAHDGCVNTWRRRAAGSSAINLPSSGVSALLVRRDVVDGLADRLDLLGILVRDLDPELILELHDQLDEIERVRVEVFLERRLLGDLALLDPELIGQDLLDPFEDFLARSCHITPLVDGLAESAPMLTRHCGAARGIVRPGGRRHRARPRAPRARLR